MSQIPIYFEYLKQIKSFRVIIFIAKNVHQTTTKFEENFHKNNIVFQLVRNAMEKETTNNNNIL